MKSKVYKEKVNTRNKLVAHIMNSAALLKQECQDDATARKVAGSIPALGLTQLLTEKACRGKSGKETSDSIKCGEFLDYMRAG
jgi:hypothetical protein